MTRHIATPDDQGRPSQSDRPLSQWLHDLLPPGTPAPDDVADTDDDNEAVTG